MFWSLLSRFVRCDFCKVRHFVRCDIVTVSPNQIIIIIINSSMNKNVNSQFMPKINFTYLLFGVRWYVSIYFIFLFFFVVIWTLSCCFNCILPPISKHRLICANGISFVPSLSNFSSRFVPGRLAKKRKKRRAKSSGMATPLRWKRSLRRHARTSRSKTRLPSFIKSRDCCT